MQVSLNKMIVHLQHRQIIFSNIIMDSHDKEKYVYVYKIIDSILELSWCPFSIKATKSFVNLCARSRNSQIT